MKIVNIKLIAEMTVPPVPLDKPVIDIAHVVQRHILPRDLAPQAINPTNNVSFGYRDNGKRTGTVIPTTFFPPGADPQNLIDLLHRSQEIASLDHTTLNYDPVTGVHVEVYTRHNGAAVVSFFPVYFFSSYVPGIGYSLTSEDTISSEKMLGVAKSLLQGYYPYRGECPVKYIVPGFDEMLVIDLSSVIGPHIGGVERGILMAFPKSVFHDIKGLDDKLLPVREDG